MNTPVYWGMDFREFVKKFNLSDEELISLVEEYNGDAPLKIKHGEDGTIYLL